MTFMIATFIWNTVINLSIAGLGISFVTKKMRENNRKRQKGAN